MATIMRLATTEDAAAIQSIYAPYVLETSITFETEVPTVQEFKRRIAATLERYPYVVTELNGDVVGFAYASAFRPRSAYIHSVETSVYVNKNLKRNGIGSKLYSALAQILAQQNVYNLNACVAHLDKPNKYVPETSRHFHEKIGFVQVARFNKCAWKFNQWIDMIWMEWIPQGHPAVPAEFAALAQVDATLVQNVLSETC